MTYIQWNKENTTFLMSISDPYHSGWYDVVIELEGNQEEALQGAQDLLEEGGYYRPHDNWDWKEINTTYMKKRTTYHQTKVRKHKGDEEE